MVGEWKDGDNNKYADIKVQLESGEVMIRVIKTGLKTNFRDFIDKAVKLSQVSIPKDQGGCFFYNEKYGGSFQQLSYKLSYPLKPVLLTPLSTVTADTAQGMHSLLTWIGEIEDAPHNL